ncbi:ATP-dependent DNA helicase RecG [Crenothrix polyspora]|uniref:ATP-dependent DNA helicase RecG n=1 Tax=Crenothrix polyspora TaxID=360316 RepID=A0A1R4HA15_9GAMM|nr:ATP-dependent DNA helicase RecG [Crenothrix polyspora]SJM93059.1 ATP-dependent DNA helicase [Crenothrix polyspora]
MSDLKQSVTALAGIGSHTANRLANLGIHIIQDLLFHLPSRYEDRTQVYRIGALQAGMTALIKGKVECTDVLQKGRTSLICKISDGTGFLDLKFFHFSASQQNSLKAGVFISCFAEVRVGYAGLEMVHPEYSVLASMEAPVAEASLTPVYPLTEGLNQAVIRKAVKLALAVCNTQPALLPDWIPAVILQNYHYPDLLTAIHAVHHPQDSQAAAALQAGESPALKRLAFEELLAHHLVLRSARVKSNAWHAPVFVSDAALTAQFLQSLAFSLTGAQQRVIADIEQDFHTGRPMMRLVQGDVGSGKTIVAAYAALLALAAGYQVAVMAPTELLAEQHFKNFSTWFGIFDSNVVFLTGQLKGAARHLVLQHLQDNTANVVIGTHALFQDSVNFAKLGLIIIDEQHRFGVHQRMALREKGQHDGMRPHQLVMTATPIPRTLAMLQYSDLDLSVIDELPPGRTPIVTVVISAERRSEVIERINNWVDHKKQVYWVCTLIEESDALQAEAAEITAQRLAMLLPKVRVGLLHGRMKTAEKNTVMGAFKCQQLDLLVATTVIEVGVDVPNASLMVIENPERLGLSQLHQLRGRVGRGVNDSYCVLMYQAPLSETARLRLGILRDSHDGFVIAEKDLQLRGPGEVMGVRQTGAIQFKVADLRRDSDLLDNIQHAADYFITHTPHAIEPLCERWLGISTDYSEV